LGIGALLEDGIGDTIRVSLTEDPELEVPVAQRLVNRYTNRTQQAIEPASNWLKQNPEIFYSYKKRTTQEVYNFGGSQVPRVIANYSSVVLEPKNLADIGFNFDPITDKWTMTELGADYIYLGTTTAPFMLPVGLKAIYDLSAWQKLFDKSNAFPIFNSNDFLIETAFSGTLNFLRINTLEIIQKEILAKIGTQNNLVLVLESDQACPLSDFRNAFGLLHEAGINVPVIFGLNYPDVFGKTDSLELSMLFSSTDSGSLLIDGFGDGIFFINSLENRKRLNDISFGILQAARTRISKTEYISCPSCGRTLFDLQETTALIRKRTDHLKGIKIAIMGCIVNGPGEMADADYGYVGSGPGKITLYKGKDVVKKAINTENAVDLLIDLIKENGDWVEIA
jgi:(E)-4-hydroxy-3-methylbut-2-enyl-diphosphate synthase